MQGFEVARGEHVGAVDPGGGFIPKVALTWEAFVAQVTTITERESKDGPYICRPMGGDGHRSDANAQEWPLMPVDLDDLQPDDVKQVHEWCEKSGLALVLATTYSHTPDHPRLRMWIRCSRPVAAAEHAFLHRSFAEIFPFKLDVAVAKPSQPIFLPACPPARKAHAFAREYPGKSMNVDAMLKGYADVIREQEETRRNLGKGIKTGVRTAGGTIDLFNQHFDLRDLMDNHPDYRRRGRNRYMYVGSTSKRPAVILYPKSAGEGGDTVISFHTSGDPLARPSAAGVARRQDAFAAYTILEHNDDFKAAFEGARRWVSARGLDATEKKEDGPPEKPMLILTTRSVSKNLAPRESVIQGLLERRSITLATGDSNSGKTTILQYQSLCVATGRSFGEHTTTKAKVLWVAGEDAYNAQIRYLGLMQKLGLVHDDLEETLFILPQRIEVMRPDSLSTLHEAIASTLPKHEDIGAIYLDSKSMVWGGEDENSNDEAARFIQILHDDFAQRYGAAVVVTHHLTKFKEKAQQTARGAGALINNADQEWRFDKNGNDRIVAMEHGKLRMAPWAAKNFFIEVYELKLDAETEHLRDNFGAAPKISIPQLVNAAGVSVANLSRSLEEAIVLTVLQLNAVKKRKGGYNMAAVADAVLRHPASTEIRKAIEEEGDFGAQTADELHARRVKKYKDRLTRTVKEALLLAKHINEEWEPTKAGIKFAAEELGPFEAGEYKDVGDQPEYQEE